MNILDILSPEAVKAPLEATEKQAAIYELVELLADAGLIDDADKLKAVVWEREEQRSTGIGEGLAIPHGKCECAPKLAMAIGRAAQPIDFASVDKKPVHLVVLLASPPDKTAEHIQALGKISRLMANREFREAAYAAESGEALYELFRKAER
jgi:fructose-specific phosphotransferase system IIA component